MSPRDRDHPQAATSVQTAACGCPSIHLMLRDEYGHVFAVAVMPVETAASLVRDIQGLIAETLARGSDTIGRCDGHA